MSSAQTRTYRQPRRCPLGWGFMREHSHLAEHDIRHILFSTRTLPHFAACLHSNPRQQDWIQLEAGHGHRSLNQKFSHFSRQKILLINKVTNFIISMLQDTGSPSWGNIPMTLSTNAGLASIYIRQGDYFTPFAYVSGNPRQI